MIRSLWSILAVGTVDTDIALGPRPMDYLRLTMSPWFVKISMSAEFNMRCRLQAVLGRRALRLWGPLCFAIVLIYPYFAFVGYALPIGIVLAHLA